MSSALFKRTFSWSIPSGQFEVEGLRRIRNWMNLSGYSSEQAFEKIFQNKPQINKHFFNEQITKLKGVEFTSPELELLFKHFDQNKDGYIDFNEWSAKIFEDSTNCLALI